MNLRFLTSEDLPQVARVHSRAFPRTAMAKLGLEALRRYYYSLMHYDEGAKAIGAFVDDRLIGFCFVGIRRQSDRTFLRHNFVFVAWRIALNPRLLREPMFRDRIVLGVRLIRELLSQPFKRRRERTAGTEVAPEPRSFGIQYLATDPAFHGHGVGKALLGAGEQLSRELGYREIHLGVVPENRHAIGFYQHMGWSKVPDGASWTGLMHKRLA